MKSLYILGVALLLIGLLSFVVPIPRHEDHSVKIGDAKIGVKTERSEKLPTAASAVILGAGVLVLFLGSRKA
jgi:hypothetical protein